MVHCCPLRDKELNSDHTMTCIHSCRFVSQELSLLDYTCLQHEPSRIAAAALLVAEAHTGVIGSVQCLTDVTGYTPISLQVRNFYLELKYATTHPLSNSIGSISLVKMKCAYLPLFTCCRLVQWTWYHCTVLLQQHAVLNRLSCPSLKNMHARIGFSPHW